MYLHLGQSVVVPHRDVVGIFDLDNTTWSRRTDLVTSSMSGPAASRREVDPFNTGVVKVFPRLSSSSWAASIFTR